MPAAAPAIDLSRLPAPAVVLPLNLQTILDARIADFRGRWTAFDALLESDPALKLQETDAYREMIVRAAINDAARSVMIAFAVGSDLDHLAAFYRVLRLAEESDDALRRRVLLAPEAFSSAGPQGAYIFHALSADARVLNVDVWSSQAGHVTVAVQSRDGDGAASDELVEIVRARLAQPHIKPLTDVLSVRSIVNVPYTISVQGFVLPGPSPQLVREEMIAALTAMAAQRRTPSRDVPRSAVTAAASVGPIDKVVVASPVADIARGHGEVALCTAIDATVTSYAG